MKGYGKMMNEEENNDSVTEEVSADEVAGDAPEADDGAKEAAEADEGDGADKTEATGKKGQSKALNAKFAQERREREAKAKAERDAKEAERRAYVKGQLDSLRTNPYTDEPITDELDLEQYKIMKGLDDAGKDPIKGFAKAWAERTRSEAAKRQESEKAEASKREEESRKARGEVDDLMKAYPDLDTSSLAKDEGFQKFADGKYGRWTLKEIYEAYKGAGKPAESRARAKSSPSSLPGGTSEPKSVSSMTDEEFLRYRMEKYGH